MDKYLFIFLIVAIVLLLVARVYFFRYKSKENRMPGGRTDDSPADSQKDENNNDSNRIAAVTARFEENRNKNVAAPVKNGEVLTQIAHVNKSYGGKPVVQDVSFAVQKGEILGLVGPNGAGKTTTIRMLMDIVKPDSGGISIFGHKLDENVKNKIGYLPEERGLYRKMKVSDSLVYLASLKDVPSSVARDKSEALLKQVDMYAHRGKKVNELSRGMGQIIQFLVTIAHNPDLVVLDEPFSGLDPVNRMLLKNFILELKAQGKSVILSTHMMNEVEEMCDRIIMIDKGRVVLYGDLSEIKWRFRNNSVFVKYDGDAGELAGVSGQKDHGKYIELFLDGRAKPQDILDQLIAKHVRIDRFEVSTPSLNEIFIQVVKHE